MIETACDQLFSWTVEESGENRKKNYLRAYTPRELNF